MKYLPKITVLLMVGAVAISVSNLLASDAAIQSLPVSVRGEAQQLSNQVKSLEDLAAKPLPERDDEAQFKLSQIKSRAQRLRDGLATLRKSGERAKVSPDHPAFVEIEQRIAAAEGEAPGQAGQLQERQAKDEATLKQADATVASVGSEGQALRDFVHEQGGLSVPGVNPQSVENLKGMKQRIEAIETRRQNAVKKIASLTSAYGGDVFKVGDALQKAGSLDTSSATSAIDYVYRGLPKEISEARAAAGSKVAQISQSSVDSFEKGSMHDFDFKTRLAELPQQLTAAQAIAPEQAELGKLKEKIKERSAAWTEAHRKRIDGRRFEHGPDTDTSAGTLAGARDFAKREWEKEGKYEFRGVVVANQWRATLTDALGRPTQYGLPVTIAVKSPKDTGENVYRFFELTLVTSESANPEKKPPFIGNHVGDSGFIRPAVVDKKK